MYVYEFSSCCSPLYYAISFLIFKIITVRNVLCLLSVPCLNLAVGLEHSQYKVDALKITNEISVKHINITNILGAEFKKYECYAYPQ